MKLQTAVLVTMCLSMRANAADEVAALLDKLAVAYGGSQRL